MRCEDPLLFTRGQAREQLQNLDRGVHGLASATVAAGGTVGAPLTNGVSRVSDLTLAAAKHQNVALGVVEEFFDRVGDGFGLISGDCRIVLGCHIPNVDGVGATFHREDGCGLPRGVGEVSGESLGVDRGRCDDDPKVGSASDQTGQIAKQEVDVEAALMGLVDDDRVVAA